MAKNKPNPDDYKNDPGAQRVAERIQKSNIDAVPVMDLPESDETELTPNHPISDEDKKAKEHPTIDGPVTVDDPLRNDNRRNAEEAVIAEHGEKIRDSGKFEELVQKKLVAL